MVQDQYNKGLVTIRVALEDALRERGVAGGIIESNVGSDAATDVEYSVTVNGKTEAQLFARQEIEDSAQAIDAPAAIKVRMLVSPFVR
jgi:hypothetical protein